MRTTGEMDWERAGDVFASVFLVAAILAVLYLAESVPLDILATPTPVCVEEIEILVVIFFVWNVVKNPVESRLSEGDSRLTRLFRRKAALSLPVRAVLLAVFIVGTFVFAFWSLSDILGSYFGYNYAFTHYPVLGAVYRGAISQIPFISRQDKGTQASFFFGVACVALAALWLERGVWRSIRDVATLFAAPLLTVLELGIWAQAPEDMTWHVTDYLWIGGTADGGYRALDMGGAYLISNWLLLAAVLLLVASRVPWLSIPRNALPDRLGKPAPAEGSRGPETVATLGDDEASFPAPI
jgi:hypothetical protein